MVARFRTEISRVNVFAVEKSTNEREESFEKSVIDARDFVNFLRIPKGERFTVEDY